MGKFVRSFKTNERPSEKNEQTNGDSECMSAVRKLALDSHGIFVVHFENGQLESYTVNGAKLGSIDAGEKLNAMEIVPGGHTLVTGGEICHVVFRSLHDLEIKNVLDLGNNCPVQCIAFTSPHENIAQLMFIGMNNGDITVVNKTSKDGGRKTIDSSAKWWS